METVIRIRDVGVISPGEMGGAIALRLAAGGFTVHAALDGRSEATRARAAAAGLHDCGEMEALVRECDLAISVVSPAQAETVASAVAAAIRSTGRRIAFADLNAISPGTAREEDRVIREAGGIFIDGGIIGPPPRSPNARTRFWVSGPEAAAFEQLGNALQVRILSDSVGDASALKMCYAALTKGLTAITVELLVAARRLGVEEVVAQELHEARSDVLDWQLGSLATMPPRAERWVPEMRQIASTFGALGLPSRIFDGAADLFAMVAETPLGRETAEQARAAARPGLEVTRSIADSR